MSAPARPKVGAIETAQQIDMQQGIRNIAILARARKPPPGPGLTFLQTTMVVQSFPDLRE